MWIIHVNRNFIYRNGRDGANRPVFTVKKGRSGSPRYAREVRLNGPSRCVYSQQPLSCGAKAWMETEVEPELIDEMTFDEVNAI